MRRTKEYGSSERRQLKNIICEKTGYYIRGNCLLSQAFTRSSYSAEQGGENNEILEFIGDQILSYYVVKTIADNYGALNSDHEYTFRIREKHFTALKQEFISNETLAKIIDEWQIAEYLIVGKSDYLNEVDKQVKVKADLFEAILGAIAVASKWDSKVLEKAVCKMLSMDEKIKSVIQTDYRPVEVDMENAVNTLKELAEHGGCSIPKYEYGTPENLGYDKDGKPIWVCTCTVINDKTGIRRQVWTSSKKAAKKTAAYLVLCEHFGLPNQYGINSKCIVWTYKNGKLMPGALYEGLNKSFISAQSNFTTGNETAGGQHMLRLRRFEKEDAGEIVTWIKDEVSFRKWSADLFDHYPITANDLQENYDNAIRVMKDRFIPLVAQDDDGIVGQLFIRFPDEEKRIGRFGFVIVDDKKRGMGYGKQMLQLALEYAFNELKASKVTLGVFENNKPAYYCYKAAGFEEVVSGETEYYEIMGEKWKCLEMEFCRTPEEGTVPEV